MKYFTPDLIARLDAPEAAVADAADAEWDRRLEEYEERLSRWMPKLPEHMRAFNELLLHDARVSSMGQYGDRFVLVLLKGIPPRDLVTLTYTLAEAPAIDKEALPPGLRSPVMDYQYNEFAVVRDGDDPLYEESILFGNGWEVRLRFGDINVSIGEPIYAAPAQETSAVLA